MSIKGFKFDGVVHKYDYNSLENIPDLNTETDKTLAIDGVPADAKATGDRISNLQSLVGSPLTASTAASMTNTNKVYVYTGSETGYTNGNWYYYDGSAWVSGGVYNSVAVDIDTTLTLSNKAPDSKVVGDAISSLNEDITNIGKSGNYASGVSYPVNLCTKDFWTGKTGIINGDSIARGIMYIDGSTPVTVEKPFGAYAFEKLGASLIQNYAVGGATLSHGSITVQDTLRTMDKTADIVLISAGSNDCAASRTLGQVGDTTIYTFYGALYVTLTYLRDTYEGKYIFFCTPIQRGAYGATNNNGNTLNEFRNAIIEMCDQFNIPVVDMLKESHVDPIVRPEIFYDGQHPIQIGHDMMGEYLAGVMTSLANSEIIAKSDYTVKGSFANQIYETLGLYVDENGDISQREDV